MDSLWDSSGSRLVEGSIIIGILHVYYIFIIVYKQTLRILFSTCACLQFSTMTIKLSSIGKVPKSMQSIN